MVCFYRLVSCFLLDLVGFFELDVFRVRLILTVNRYFKFGGMGTMCYYGLRVGEGILGWAGFYLVLGVVCVWFR